MALKGEFYCWNCLKETEWGLWWLGMLFFAVNVPEFVYFGGFLMSDADQLYGDDKLC